MTTHALSSADLLQAAQIPGAAGLYFIGPYTSRITFFSQQVRALRLAHAIDALGQVKPNERIAVVGAGAAGATMAVALALLGYNATLYDRADDILQLQSASPRLLHPHIYEWPKLGSLDERAGLPVMDWVAGTGATVCTTLRAEFQTLLTGLSANLIFQHGHTLTDLTQSGSEWELKFGTLGGADTRIFDHVVLAMGFGDEIPCGTVVPEDYWKPGSIGTATTETVTGVRYVVSGNGDGALTVTLGLLVKDFEHDRFTREFLGYFKRDQLRTAADQVFGGTTFEQDIEPQLRATVLPILSSYGVLDKLRQRLRRDRLVTINADGPLFAAGKASQLNQCMVLAVLEAAAESISVSLTTGFVSDCRQTTNGIVLVGTQIGGNPDTTAYKHAILRHGPNVADRYKPAGTFVAQYKTHVQSLIASNPKFSAPPALDDQTYNFFEGKSIARLAGPSAQALRCAISQQSQHVIEISIDRATHILVERGSQRVADIALQCEQLPHRFTIELYVAPDAFPDAADLVRLARCSEGKIELRAGAEVVTAWKQVSAIVSDAPPPSSVRPVGEYGPAAVANCVDAALVRLLDHRIQNAIAQGAAAPLGTISPAILAHVENTWNAWRSTLNGNLALRFDFLRWLANVDQRKAQPWDGNHGALQHMANALIMIAATHSGEALTPCSIAAGNIEFAAAAVALGTGCEAIGTQPLSSRSTPDDWGVDALILSAATDVIVEYPIGTVMDGGDTSTSMKNARRVPPAIIQGDKKWRDRLGGSFQELQDAVKKEFDAWRKRQDDEITRVTG